MFSMSIYSVCFFQAEASVCKTILKLYNTWFLNIPINKNWEYAKAFFNKVFYVACMFMCMFCMFCTSVS